MTMQRISRVSLFLHDQHVAMNATYLCGKGSNSVRERLRRVGKWICLYECEKDNVVCGLSAIESARIFALQFDRPFRHNPIFAYCRKQSRIWKIMRFYWIRAIQSTDRFVEWSFAGLSLFLPTSNDRTTSIVMEFGLRDRKVAFSDRFKTNPIVLRSLYRCPKRSNGRRKKCVWS